MGRRSKERREKIRAGLEKPIGGIPTDPREKVTMGLCPFPGCPSRRIQAPGSHGFCAAHEKFASDILFILQFIRTGPVERPDGLVLPGQPGFDVVRGEP